jgi:glucose/arabinose dehydrogenase
VRLLRHIARVAVAVVLAGVIWVSDPEFVDVRTPHYGAVALADGFARELVASGLDGPTAFAFLPDGRLLIAEKKGVVRLWKDGRVLPTPFLDISHEVNAFYERGLLGLAVDPAFEENGHVYLLYTYENDPSDFEGLKVGHLSRFTATGDTADPDSEVVVLGTKGEDRCEPLPPGSDCIPQDWNSHAVGQLRFAADGTLFVSIGEAAPWEFAESRVFRSQDLDSLGGKLLRITTDGRGLPTNPFWNGDPDAPRSKVWAYGFRNPFRFALRPGTDVAYVGDVGWGAEEEVSVAARGANLGWPCWEGEEKTHDFRDWEQCRAFYETGGATPPILSWEHGHRQAASFAGDFYTGTEFPDEYRGAFFYGDFVLGFVNVAQVDDDDEVLSVDRFATNLPGIVQLGMGPDGALYEVDFVKGELHRIVYDG